MNQPMTYSVEQIMEQAQVFASAWALVGSPFDAGDQLEAAELEKDLLTAMVVHALEQENAAKSMTSKHCSNLADEGVSANAVASVSGVPIFVASINQPSERCRHD